MVITRLVRLQEVTSLTQVQQRSTLLLSAQKEYADIFIANHNGLTIWGGDVGNTYLKGYTRVKVFTILGQKYGPDFAGCVTIISKGLCGLKTSGAQWSEHLADTLRSQG